MSSASLYEERLRRVQDAINLVEPDIVPVIPKVAGTPYHLYSNGTSHVDENYGYAKAAEAYIKYHEEFQPDVRALPEFMSGTANEIAETTMLDWPGRPGTSVPDFSTYQVIENEYMSQDEYEELLCDYTGFIFRKYIPRAYPGLKGFENLQINPAVILGTKPFTPMLGNDTKSALQNFIRIIDACAEASEQSAAIDSKLDSIGFPPYYTGAGEIPYDILSDYFRGTMGIFEDILEIPEKIKEANTMFVDIQKKNLKYLKDSPIRIKRVFFPLHKGMDGFMSPSQYDKLYWSPYQELLKYLVDIGVTPIIYCEGPYNTRIDYIHRRLYELPAGSCVIHFETGDFAELKKKFSDIACLSGGMPLYLLEYGSKQDVIDRTKYLIDNCATGGGYLLNSSGSIEKVKRENFEAMFETARTYGKK
jgi:intein/homing endonuclease